jgi:AcrR family transcriptional regulator
MTPRIQAASIEEHVRRQTTRILDAATVLFRTRGYRNTDMQDIAASVGLARNSLYRYYPNKDYILVACVQRDMAPFVEELRGLAAAHPDPVERIGAWLDACIEMACSPAHATLELMGEIRESAPELRREIMVLHKLPNEVLEAALEQLPRNRRRDVTLLSAMISGMVEATATQAIRGGNKNAVKRELRRAVEKILEA